MALRPKASMSTEEIERAIRQLQQNHDESIALYELIKKVHYDAAWIVKRFYDKCQPYNILYEYHATENNNPNVDMTYLAERIDLDDGPLRKPTIRKHLARVKSLMAGLKDDLAIREEKQSAERSQPRRGYVVEGPLRKSCPTIESLANQDTAGDSPRRMVPRDGPFRNLSTHVTNESPASRDATVNEDVLMADDALISSMCSWRRPEHYHYPRGTRAGPGHEELRNAVISRDNAVTKVRNRYIASLSRGLHQVAPRDFELPEAVLSAKERLAADSLAGAAVAGVKESPAKVRRSAKNGVQDKQDGWNVVEASTDGYDVVGAEELGEKFGKMEVESGEWDLCE
ncbi:MAG: hypothetical protein Q9168_007824 [Polycauliona sp. 1 TL-2023]